MQSHACIVGAIVFLLLLDDITAPSLQHVSARPPAAVHSVSADPLVLVHPTGTNRSPSPQVWWLHTSKACLSFVESKSKKIHPARRWERTALHNRQHSKLEVEKPGEFNNVNRSEYRHQIRVTEGNGGSPRFAKAKDRSLRRGDPDSLDDVEVNEAEHREEKEEDDDEEEEEEESFVSVAIGATLLAGVSFMLTLSYLVNHSDPDIRQASYEVISATISIFCAVLLFQAVNEALNFCLVSKDSTKFYVFSISIVELLFWHALTEFSLGYFTGMIGSELPTASQGEIHCQTKCYAVLLAHVTGFAAIHAAGCLQQTYFNGSWTTSLNAVIMTFVFLRILQVVSEQLRAWDMSHIPAESALKELWEDETEEAENDVMAFALSFSLVQSLRYGIGGVMPDALGKEAPATYLHHDSSESLTLLVVGFSFLACTFVSYYTLHRMGRFLAEMVATAAMCFAWCYYYATMWYVGALSPPTFAGNYNLMSVITAMACSFFAFTSIFIIDHIADRMHNADLPDMENALRNLIRIMGILVGFAWEQAFDEAEESIADVTEYPKLIKLCMAFGSVCVLIPAWRWNVLPFVVMNGWKFGFIAEHVNEDALHDAMVEKFGGLEGLLRFMETTEKKHKEDLFDSLAETCSCGNIFMPDSVYCRKCGSKRPSKSFQTCLCTPRALEKLSPRGCFGEKAIAV